MSTHAVEIIELGDIYAHPNSDKLECTRVYGWQCCLRKGDFKKGDRAIYIEPDFCVPLDNALFSFLKKADSPSQMHRIRSVRLRGELSQGLLVHVPYVLQHLPTGSNVIEHLGIVRYEPPLPLSSGGNFVQAPVHLATPVFDVENYQRYSYIFSANEEVIATEKLHGANARFVYCTSHDGEKRQFCGTRTNWIGQENYNYWWVAFHQNPCIEEWCKNNENSILYGECFGNVASLKYGAKRNQIFFACFAIYGQNGWLDYDDMVESCRTYGVPVVPLVYRGPFDEKKLYALAENDSIYPGASHMSEGLVILPIKERWDSRLGRVCLKMVSNRYLASH